MIDDVVILFAVGTNFGCAGLNIIMGRKQRKHYADRQAARDRDNPNILTIQRAIVAGLPAGQGDIASDAPDGASDGPGVDDGLPESTADVPILAYKRATLCWAPGGSFYLSGGHGNRISMDADAQCMRFSMSFGAYSKHGLAPDPECGCGFYALRSPDEIPTGYGLVRLDVELSGRVIVAETGYRAGHQRVLRLHVPACFWCGADSSHVAVIERVEGTSNAVEVRPLCAKHPTPESTSIIFPIADVMASIGFSWEDDE